MSREGPDRRVKSMMVAFRYDNGAVGSLYYSREVPSLLKGLRLSKLFGRDGIITFESNGAFVCRARRGLPRLLVPGLPRHSWLPGDVPGLPPGDQRRHAPEMSLERAKEDHRLMDQVYATIVDARTWTHRVGLADHE